MIEVELPDGTILEFPQGTSQDVMRNAIMSMQGQSQPQQAPQPAPTQPAPPQQASQNPRKAQRAGVFANAPQPQKMSPLQRADAFMHGAAQGLTFGFADEIEAGLGAATGLGGDFGDYRGNLEAIRKRISDYRANAPGTMMAGEIPGMIASAIGTGGVSALASGGGTAARMGAAAADGAIYGGLYGAGTSEGDKLADGAKSAAIGAAMGPIAQKGGDLIASGAGKIAGALTRGKQAPQMTAEQLKGAAQAAYQQADDAGVILRPEAMQRVSREVQNDLAEMAYDPAMQPALRPVMDRLNSASEGNITMKGVDTIRKMAGNAYDPMNRSQSAMAGKVSGRLDDMLDQLSPSDVLTGNADEGVAALKNAREMYQRGRKLETVDDLIEKAGLRAGSTGSGGNVENATRQNLRRMLDNPKLKRGMTADEQAQLKKAVLGTPTNNALRLAGKLSPQGNGLMMALGLGGSAIAPQVALPAMAVGAAAKKGSEAVTAKNVEKLRNLIASGGKAPPMPKAQKALDNEQMRLLIARSLLGSSIVPMAQNGQP